MSHIWSDDVAIGNTYDGTWNLQNPISGTLKLVYHFIDERDIPWVYTGINVLRLDAGGPDRSLTFSTLSADPADPAVAASMVLSFDSALSLDGVTTAVVWVPETKRFTVTFTGGNVSILWADPLTSAGLLFNKVGATDSPSIAIHLLDGRFIDPRPPTLELDIVESSNLVTATRATTATFFIPTSDFLMQDMEFQVEGFVNSLEMKWYRQYAPGIPVPMTNLWEIQFV
jgi:hypothetical protein